ncbi:dicarboxylic amino acid permease [Aureobasidium pullulans]|uniref:Dicarboxylic amino acid permease n=1 Tax=Aureobasidium pullulans TaxID=5580 RepID=A0A4S8YRC5_AURPU|nr:dicarboxylic amino acid permease [Aureobasidium pullulans]
MSNPSNIVTGTTKSTEMDPKHDLVNTVSSREGEMQDLDEPGGLRRDFKSRQVNMIAIAGALGTGLIIGTGRGLARGGPGSLLLAYIITGAIVYWVMAALGEMASFAPMQKGFNGYAARYIDPAFGFATGWNYFFKYAIVLANNLTAAGLIIQYWKPGLNVGIWITVFGALVVLVNVFSVSKFGEAEFLLSSLKIITLVVVMITCLIVALGGGPDHDRRGFRYWNHSGAFANYLEKGPLGKFLGFWACLVQSFFAYTGTEVVGVAFGETPNPRRNIPRAVRQTLWRVGVFYVLGVFILGMVVPYNNKRLIGSTHASTSAEASPYVIAIKLAGIKVLPDIINASLLVFVLSAANTDIYVGARTLHSLAKEGQAPKIFEWTSKSGVPLYGVAATSAFALLAYMNVAKSASTVFGYFVSLVTVFGALNWISILVSYIGFIQALRAQKISLSELPYRGFLQPYGAWFSLCLTVLVVLFNGYNAFIPKFQLSTFMTCYIGIVVYLVNIFAWKLIRKTKRVQPGSVEFPYRHEGMYA